MTIASGKYTGSTRSLFRAALCNLLDIKNVSFTRSLWIHHRALHIIIDLAILLRKGVPFEGIIIGYIRKE